MNGMEAGCRPENPHKKEPRKVLLMDRYRGRQVRICSTVPARTAVVGCLPAGDRGIKSGGRAPRKTRPASLPAHHLT